jgi:Ca2+-binding EF-hand superfamily protein
MQAQDLIYLFQKDDTDGDGELSFLEFRSALSGLGLKLPLPHVSTNEAVGRMGFKLSFQAAARTRRLCALDHNADL